MRLSADLRASGVLLCCAHPSEAKALPEGLGCLVTGVGKVSAAATLAHHLATQGPIAGVFIFGVAGVYPNAEGVFDPALSVGTALWVQSDALVDEGVVVEQGFLDLDALGLRGQAPARYHADPAWMKLLHRRLAAPQVAGATVSSCSGTDALSQSRVRQSKAQVETMEGAALAHCCLQQGIPWVQLRVISNRCGERANAGWDLALSVSVLRQSLRQLVE